MQTQTGLFIDNDVVELSGTIEDSFIGNTTIIVRDDLYIRNCHLVDVLFESGTEVDVVVDCCVID